MQTSTSPSPCLAHKLRKSEEIMQQVPIAELDYFVHYHIRSRVISLYRTISRLGVGLAWQGATAIGMVPGARHGPSVCRFVSSGLPRHESVGQSTNRDLTRWSTERGHEYPKITGLSRSPVRNSNQARSVHLRRKIIRQNPILKGPSP
jgi:hypothetical protein